MKVAIVIFYVYLYGPYYGFDFSVHVSISPMFSFFVLSIVRVRNFDQLLQLEEGFVATQN